MVTCDEWMRKKLEYCPPRKKEKEGLEICEWRKWQLEWERSELITCNESTGMNGEGK